MECIFFHKDYKVIENYTLKLFELGAKRASKQGLVLVDTKYEFGKDSSGNILLIDEIQTFGRVPEIFAFKHFELEDHVEKPRTKIGWKGLISDPFLNNSNQI